MRRRTALPRRALPSALLIAALGCGARPQVIAATSATDEVQLYRDRALIEQRIAIVAASAGRTTVALRVPGDVGPASVVVLDLGGLTASEVRLAHGDAPIARAAVDVAARRGPSADLADPLDSDAALEPELEARVEADARAAAEEAAEAAAEAEAEARADPSVITAEDARALDDPPPPAARAQASELELVVDAPRAGRFVVALGYATQRVRWDAAYTITTTPAHERATVRGAVTIQNAGGAALRARTRVVDAELGAWHDRLAARLRAALHAAGEPRAPEVAVRDLGVIAIGEGETRVELLAGDPPRALRSVLVYDPIGAELDHPGAAPASDPELGARAPMTTRITESLELARDGRAHRGLPGGVGQLIEHRGDGARVVLGAARLFDAARRAARVETIAIGTAQGLLGHRERRDWAKDDDQRRFSEEFLLTIESTRPRPVEIVIREHLYRGQNWTLAYQSAPAAKEGSQQIALRAAVPANGRAKVLYVVVYTW